METDGPFGEAATLYARYANTVAIVRQAFLDDVTHFLNRVREAASALADRDISIRDTSGSRQSFRYWWIGEPTVSKDRYPQLWCEIDSPAIVLPGLLDLRFMYPNSAESVVQKMEAEVRAALVATCTVERTSSIAFSIKVDLDHKSDSVGHAARVLGTSLRIMDDLKAIPTD